MPQYTLTITIPNAGNRKVDYTLNLIDNHEIYPEDFFRLKENCDHLSQTIQQQSARKLDDNQIKRIISEWIRDIKQGYRNTDIILDLTPDTVITSTPVSHPVVTPNLSIPKPKQAIKPPSPPSHPVTQTYPPSPDPWTNNETSAPPQPIPTKTNTTSPSPAEAEQKAEETLPADTWKAGNKCDDF